MASNDVTFALKLTADSKELVGEVKLSRDELDKLGQSTRNAGSEAARLNQQNKSLAASFAEQAGEMAKAAVSLAAIHGTIKSAIRASNEYTAAITGLASVSRHAGEDIQQTLNRATALTSDGLLSVSESALALKNLLARGFTTDQAVQMIERFKDSAAFGRQASLDFGQAVVSATEGIKNENSILVDNAGVTKNVSVMWKEYAAQIGVSVDHLTQAQKRQAEYNGILAETEGQLGNAALASDGLMGAQARMDASIKASATALGQSLTPAVTAAANGLEYLSENAVKPIIFGMEALGIKAAETASKVSLTLSFLTSPDKWSGGLAKWINSPEYKAQIAALEKLSTDMLTASAGRISGATGPEAPNIGADSGARRADVVLNGKAEVSRKAAKEIADAATVAAKAYAALIKSGQEYTTQLAAEHAGHEKLTKSAKLLAEARATLPPGLLMAVEAELSWAQALESSIDAEKRDFEQAQATHKARLTAVAELNKAEAERIDALNKSVASAQADAASQREAYETYGMSAAAVREMTTAKLEARLAGLDFASSTIEEVTALEAQIKALKEATRWASKTEVLDANARTAEEAAREWERINQQIGQSLTDEIMRGGKSAGELLEDYFRTLVLRPIIQGVVNVGMNAIGLGASGAGNQFAGAGNMINTGSSLYSAFSGGWNAPGSLYSQFATSGVGASLGLSTGVTAGLSPAAVELGFGTLAANGASAGSGIAGSSLTGLGSTLGAALPWVAAGVAILSMVGKSGETRQGQHYGYSGTSLDLLHGPSGGAIADEQMRGGTLAAIQQTNSLLQRYSPGTVIADYHAALESSEKGRGGVYAGGRLSTGAVFGESGQGSNYNGTLYERTSSNSPDSKAAAEQYALDLSQATLQAIRAADIGGTVGDLLAASLTESTDAIESLTQQQADGLIAGLSGGWLDDLVGQLDPVELGFEGVATAAARLAARLPELAQQTGLTAEAIGTSFRAALTESASAAEAGQIFAGLATNGVYEAMQGQHANSITQLVMGEIVNPMLLAIELGADVADALSTEVINAAIGKAEALAGAYTALLNSPEFTAAMDRLRQATSGIGAGAYVARPADYYVRQSAQSSADASRYAADAARAAEDAARAMLAAQTSLVDAQVGLIQGLQSAAADWRALSTGLEQDMLRLSRLDPDFDAVGHFAGQIETLLGDWRALVGSARDPDSLSYQSEQAELAGRIHRTAMDRYEAEMDALAKTTAATRDQARAALDLRRYVEGLRTGDLSPLSFGQKLAEAQSQYRQLLARAQGGDLEAQARLTGVADTLLRLGQGYYGGASTDYAEMFRQVTGAVEGLAQPQRSTEALLADIAGADATYNTAALDIARRAQSDLAVIKSVTDARLAEVNASVIALGGSLRGYLSTRPDVAANTTIPDAVYTSMGQTAPVAATVSNPTGRPAYTAYDVSHDQMRDIIARAGITDGQTLYREVLRHQIDPYVVGAAYGLDRSGTDQWLADQQVVRVPGFAVGTNRLPADTLAMVHQDERIMPAADNRELFQRLAAPEQNAAALVAEIRALRAEVAALREDNQRQSTMLAGAVVGSNQDNATQVSGAIERAAETRRSRVGSAIL